MNHISYIHDLQKWQQDFVFSIPIKVRFSETDMFGHMNNTVPFAYFEEARIEFFNSLGFTEYWFLPGNETIPVVADLQCHFLSQVYFDERLQLYVKAAKVGTTSVDLHYLAKKETQQICFVGRGTMVQISKHTGKGVPWSSFMKEQLTKGV